MHVIVKGGPNDRSVAAQGDAHAEVVARSPIVRAKFSLLSPDQTVADEHVRRPRIDSVDIVVPVCPRNGRLAAHGHGPAEPVAGSSVVREEFSLLTPGQSVAHEYVRCARLAAVGIRI